MAEQVLQSLCHSRTPSERLSAIVRRHWRPCRRTWSRYHSPGKKTRSSSAHGDADALIVSSSPMTRRVMSALKNLKVVVRTGVGYDVIDVPAATDLGVVVVNIPDMWTREVANHALGLLLAWNRQIPTLDSQVKRGVWQSAVPGPAGALHGETVGIVGFGNIGRAFARRVAALGDAGYRLRPLCGRGAVRGLGGGARALPRRAGGPGGLHLGALSVEC